MLNHVLSDFLGITPVSFFIGFQLLLNIRTIYSDWIEKFMGAAIFAGYYGSNVPDLENYTKYRSIGVVCTTNGSDIM
uniref:Uncharacterized protein n=1 Tax=Romanomermis culicivorax TaxID=13658 RepID=A0A915HVN8_ROMCU